MTFGAKIGFEVKILAAPLFFLPTLPFSPHLFTLYIPAGAKVTEHLLGYRGRLAHDTGELGYSGVGGICSLYSGLGPAHHNQLWLSVLSVLNLMMHLYVLHTMLAMLAVWMFIFSCHLTAQ